MTALPRSLARLIAAAAIGLALLLAAIVALDGSGSAAPAKAAKPAISAPAASKPAAPAPAAAAKPSAAVPQQNGGDADPDNNGGPDDGDGGI